MSNNQVILPIGQILEDAWLKVKGVKKTFFAAALVATLIILSLVYLEDHTETLLSSGLYLTLTIASSLINFLLIAGVTHLGIRRAFDDPISYRSLLQVFKPKMAVNILGLYLLKLVINFILAFMALSFLFGAVSLIIGMCIVVFIQIRLILALAFVLDKGVTPWQALKLSFEATRYHFWRLFFLSVIQILLLGLLSFLTFGISFIWTIPYTMITYGMVYKKLMQHLEEKESFEPYQAAKSTVVDFL